MKDAVKKIILVVVLFPSFCCFGMDSLAKQKQNFVEGFQTVDQHENEFQLSLSPQKSITKILPNLSLFAGVPAIGIYGTPYDFRTRIALIEMNSAIVGKLLPEVLGQKLREIMGDYRADQIKSYVMISGKAQKTSNIYNMVFHPVVSVWQQPQRHFNLRTTMGLFDPNGIGAATGPESIGINSFTTPHVNVHASQLPDIDDASPNNAQFAIYQNRAISTFWSAAVSSERKRAVVTFHILVNDSNLEVGIQKQIKRSQNLGQLLQNLSSIPLANQADQQAFKNALAKIREMATGATVPQSKQPDLLEQALQNLAKQLQELNQELVKKP